MSDNIQKDLLKEMDDRWRSALAANCAQLKEELHQQVRRDLTEYGRTLCVHR